MLTFRHLTLGIWVVMFFAAPARAEQLVYVPLAEPCRLLDTRTSTGGPGPLTASHGAYLFGTLDIDVSSARQHGNSIGCSIPVGVEAVSVNMNLLNTTASGNISTWSADAGATAPNIGTAVYNPSVSSASAGQVQYNGGYTTVRVSHRADESLGRFYLQVANGQVDMTINLIGYWQAISRREDSGYNGVALGYETTARGFYSTALGANTTADGTVSTAMGDSTVASGNQSTAMGFHTQASGIYSTAMGRDTVASGNNSIAMGFNTTASGDYSIALGSNVSTNNYKGSFIYGDASNTIAPAYNTAENQFLVAASGGVYFFTNPFRTSGALLSPGNSSWTAVSDRNAKTAVRPVDPREVLKKVAALPLNTWQYKTQEEKYRHMGPMAQDFYAAFHLGESDKGIDTVDADGVALAAIQGLHAELTEKNQEIAALRAEKDREIAALRAELTTRVAALESLAGDLAEVKAKLGAPHRSTPAPVAVALKP